MQDSPTGADALLNLEQMIKGYLSDIERIRSKLKSQKEMFNQSFEQDKDYSEVEVQYKQLTKKKNEAKEKIVKSDAVSAVKMEVSNLQFELKEAQQALSDYLNKYVQVTQKSEFIGPDGEAFQIVRTARLVKQK